MSVTPEMIAAVRKALLTYGIDDLDDAEVGAVATAALEASGHAEVDGACEAGAAAIATLREAKAELLDALADAGRILRSDDPCHAWKATTDRIDALLAKQGINQ